MQTGLGSVWSVLKPHVGATLAVIGCGNVGLFAVMGANLLPLTRLVAVDLLDQGLEIARDLGATETVNSGNHDIVEAFREITDGRGVDYVVDTTANPHVLRSAIDALAIRGTCAVVGVPPAGTEVSIDVTGQLVARRDGPDHLITVETGLVANGWVEIIKGLDAGETIRLPDQGVARTGGHPPVVGLARS